MQVEIGYLGNLEESAKSGSSGEIADKAQATQQVLIRAKKNYYKVVTEAETDFAPCLGSGSTSPPVKVKGAASLQ